MKFIQCADLHLESAFSKNLDNEQKQRRSAELLHSFENMIEYAAGHDIHIILIAGDLFDTGHVNSDIKRTVFADIKTRSDIDFYYIRGNHDADVYLPIDEMPDNLHCFGPRWKSYELEPGTVLTGIDLSKDNIDEAYAGLQLDPNDYNILMLHGMDDRSDRHYISQSINLNALTGRGIDYIAMGHNHSFKCGRLDSRGSYAYSGVLEQRGFDECGRHGFLVCEIRKAPAPASAGPAAPDSRTLTYCEISEAPAPASEGSAAAAFEAAERRSLTYRLVNSSIRECFSIDIDISKLNSDPAIQSEIKNVLSLSRVMKKDLVKIRLTGCHPLDFTPDINYLETAFENRYYVFKAEDKSSIFIDYQSYANDASLKGEFIRTVENSELDEETKAGIIKLGLESLES